MGDASFGQELGSGLAEQGDHGLVVADDLGVEVLDTMRQGSHGQQQALAGLIPGLDNTGTTARATGTDLPSGSDGLRRLTASAESRWLTNRLVELTEGTVAHQ